MKKLYSLITTLIFAGSAFSQVTLVKDIKTGTGNSSPSFLTVYDGYLYFKADYTYDENGDGTADSDEDLGIELIKSNGTAEGTVVLSDLKTGSGNSNPNGLFIFNNYLYFNANPGTYAPYQTDGTNVTDLASGFGIVDPVILNGTCYYKHTNTLVDIKNQLFVFDGTDFSPAPLAQGSAEEWITSLVAFDNRIFTYMYLGSDLDVVGKELYAYDPTSDSWALIANIGEDDLTTDPSNPVITDASISNFTVLNDKLYFEALNALWVTDGTTDGTMAITAAEGIADVTSFYAWDNKLFFAGDNGTDGDQLYVYDPSYKTVTDLSQLSGTDHSPSDFCGYGGYLYYSGTPAGSTLKYLFRTDGTSITQLDDVVQDIDDIVVLNGVLYFEGEDASGTETTGNELFSYALDPLATSVTTDSYNTNSISLYPNPTTGVIHINGLEQSSVDYQVYDISGRMVQSGYTNNQITLNVQPGIFIVKILDGNKISTNKVQVK